MTQQDASGPVNLPAVPNDDEVVEGEIIEETLANAPPAARPAVVTVFQTITVVVQHPVPKTAARHALYVPAGVVVAWKRWQRHRNLAYDFAAYARTQGDHENGLKWAQQAELERKQRHERGVKTAETLLMLVKWTPVMLAVAVLIMAVLDVFLFIADRHTRDLAWSFLFVAHLVHLGVELVTAVSLAMVFLIPAGIVLLLHELGRRAGDLAPAWSMAGKQAGADRGLVVTADTIVLALANIPVPAIKSARKDGWKPTFTTLPVRDGRGYQAIFSLPLGVTPDMIANQRPVLARNLHREEIEVWPSAGPPGFASLWVADPGAISKAAPEYPLLHEGTADVFEGVPGGVSPRGDSLLIPVVSNNLVLGGQMGQGKSNGCRVYMLGCALDPLAVLDVFVFANNGDFDAFAPRLHIYRKGVEDDTVAAAVGRLHELYAEVARREGRLAELGAKKLTRQLAQADPDMRPVVVLFSECHELFGHPEHGGLAAELAIKTAKRARKTGIVMMFDTQSSRKEAIPPALVELVSVNGCFYVKTWRSNDGFLGDGSFQAGIRATELRPGRDRGTCVITGVSDSQFELLRWYFIPVDDDTGYDAATEVIERAMRGVARGTALAGSSAPAAAIEARDLLEDLTRVLTGDARVKIRDAVSLLRELAPKWTRYRQMSAKQLGADLAGEGVRTVNLSGTRYIDPADVRRALDGREASE